MDAKGCFLSESEIDASNCQIHMPNHYLKLESSAFAFDFNPSKAWNFNPSKA